MTNNIERKIIRKKIDEKNAKKSQGQTEFNLSKKEQYILGRANQALGVAKSNQGIVNDINVSIEANTNRILTFDDKMGKWDTELTGDLKGINEKIDTLIDVIIDLVDPNEIDDETLKKLGLESVEVETKVETKVETDKKEEEPNDTG